MNLQFYIDKYKDAKRDKYWDVQDLFGEFALGCYSFETDRLTVFDIPELSWICTDTNVGVSLLYLDNELVGNIFQATRKGDKHYFWLNKEAYDKVFDFLISLLQGERHTKWELMNLTEDLKPIEERAVEATEQLKESRKRHYAYVTRIN